MLYTILIGAANAGKTTYFVKNFKNKLIISVVPIVELFLTRDEIPADVTFINIRDGNEELKFQDNDDDDLNVLIDEIHLFTQDEHAKVRRFINTHSKRRVHLFYSIILTSYNQACDAICGYNSFLPNVLDVVARANNIIVIPSICRTCSNNTTIHSAKVDYVCANQNGILIGKQYFFPKCVTCKQQQECQPPSV